MNETPLKIKDLKERTILWLKITLIFTLAIILSYELSKWFVPLGFLYFIYLFTFGVVGTFFQVTLSVSDRVSIILPIIVLILYSLIAINYFYLSLTKKKIVRWLKVLFIVSTVLYLIMIVAGWLIFLVWHPL